MVPTKWAALPLWAKLVSIPFIISAVVSAIAILCYIVIGIVAVIELAAHTIINRRARQTASA